MSVGTPHTGRIAVIYGYPTIDNTFENVFYWNDPSDALFADIPLSAAEVYTAAINHLMNYQCPQVTLAGVLIEDVRTVPFGGFEYIPASPAVGTDGTVCGLPSCTSIAIKKLTGGIGRSARGRVYWPMFASTKLLTPDTTSPAVVALIISHLADFQTAVEALIPGSSLGIVSYVHNKVPRVAGLFQTVTSYAATDLDVDTQRRRLLGHNRHR